MIKLQNWVVVLLRKLEEASKTVETKRGDLIFTSLRGSLSVRGSHMRPGDSGNK
jgi:hypothetical protein